MHGGQMQAGAALGRISGGTTAAEREKTLNERLNAAAVELADVNYRIGAILSRVNGTDSPRDSLTAEKTTGPMPVAPMTSAMDAVETHIQNLGVLVVALGRIA